MVAMLWLYALQICTGRCSLQDTEPLQREHPASHGDAPQGLFAPRWAEIRQQSWNRVSVTHDLWPDEVVDDFFFWLVAAWVKSRAERPSVSGVNRQLHVQIGCKLGIRNRKDELTKQAKRNKLQIKPEGN